MAQFDVTQDLQSIASGAFLTIQPGAGIEWVIHNIYHENNVELYFTDGTNDLKINTQDGNDGWIGYVFHCTNGKYYKVKNTHTAAQLIGYDGIVTKSA